MDHLSEIGERAVTMRNAMLRKGEPQVEFDDDSSRVKALRTAIKRDARATPGMVGRSTGPALALLVAIQAEIDEQRLNLLLPSTLMTRKIEVLAQKCRRDGGREGLGLQAMSELMELVTPCVDRHEERLWNVRNDRMVEVMFSEPGIQEEKMLGAKKARQMPQTGGFEFAGPAAMPRYSASVRAKARDIQQIFRQGVCWAYIDSGKLCAHGCKHAPCCLKSAEDKQRFEDAKKQTEQAARGG